VDWRTHLSTLREWKEEGKVRYIGITHYNASMHGELENVLRSEPVDFLQVNYSLLEPEAGERLLPAAAERGVAVLINRPFGEGALFRRTRGKTLPAWAVEAGIQSWSQFFLLFILANPAVTAVIPATSSADHLAENLRTLKLPLPDAGLLEKMGREVDGG